MSDAAKEAAVLLYSLELDTFLEDLTRNADRVFYFDEGPRTTPRLVTKASSKTEKAKLLWMFSHNQIIMETRAVTIGKDNDSPGTDQESMHGSSDYRF